MMAGDPIRAEQAVRDFCAAWDAGDIDGVMRDIAPDCLFINGSVSVHRGHDDIRALYAAYVDGYDGFRFEITSLAVAPDGCAVHNERVDVLIKGDMRLEIPCSSVMVVERGKITHIRDYFDFAAVQAQRQAWQDANAD